MASVNRVILVGNLGRDPETRYSPDGAAITNITIATSDRWKDKASGEMKEATEWHRVVVWGKQAQVLAEHLVKGKQVYVEGSLQTRSWDDRDGNKRYTTEVRAVRVLMMGRAEGARVEPEAPAPETGPEAGGPEMNEEEVPF